MHPPRSTTLRRLADLARPEAATLAAATVALLLGSGLNLAYPQAVRWMIDAITAARPGVSYDRAALILIAMFLVGSVLGWVRVWLFTVAGERVVSRLRRDVYSAILRQDTAFFDSARTGELTNRLASDTTVLQNTVTVNVSMALRFGAGALGGMAALAWTSPVLAGLALAVVPVVVVTAALYGRALRGLSGKVQDALAGSNAIAEETIGGIRTVRSFAREPEERARYAAAVDTAYQLAARRAFASGAFQGLLGFAGQSAIALVVWYGGHLVSTDQMTIGDLTAFLLYTLVVAFSLGALSGLYGDFMNAIGASARIFDLLDQHGALEGQGGLPVPRPAGAIRFEGVTFAYPTRPDAPVLSDFDLSIAPGEVVALVGPSGSGKSTVAGLLARYYDPQAGSIFLDDRALSTLDPQQLRGHVGTVAQEPLLFAASIAENIRYGRPDATDAEVEAAARAANAEEFIVRFPERYQALVGERGVRLSGGQKQRIAIARAILKDPAILILDEATSALDSESEHLVQDALERLMKKRTTLVIAHRLSTVKDADRVVVIAAGRIAEQGTHDQLLQRDGLYRRLVERQFEEPVRPAV
jgi:ATP-binding cassette subfamily B protein